MKDIKIGDFSDANTIENDVVDYGEPFETIGFEATMMAEMLDVLENDPEEKEKLKKIWKGDDELVDDEIIKSAPEAEETDENTEAFEVAPEDEEDISVSTPRADSETKEDWKAWVNFFNFNKKEEGEGKEMVKDRCYGCEEDSCEECFREEDLDNCENKCDEVCGRHGDTDEVKVTYVKEDCCYEDCMRKVAWTLTAATSAILFAKAVKTFFGKRK